jgi:hypothetical protein
MRGLRKRQNGATLIKMSSRQGLPTSFARAKGVDYLMIYKVFLVNIY